MTITDHEHALRVIKSLVEQGEEIQKGVTPGKWEAIGENLYLSDMISIRANQKDGKSPRIGVTWCRYTIYDQNTISHGDKPEGITNANFIAKSRSLVPALVEGAQAVLDEWESYGARDDDKTHEFTQGIEFELRNFTIRQARAFAPRMVEVGMKVPD